MQQSKEQIMKRIIGGGVVVLVTGSLFVAGYTVTSRCNLNAISSHASEQVAVPTSPLRASIKFQLEATPDEVFDYISSEQTLPEWMPGLESLRYDHSNVITPGVLGKGSRRTMMFGEQSELEEIVEFNRPTVVAYRILEGVPVKNHLAVFIIEESDRNRSTVTWNQYFDIERSSASGWLMPFMVRRFINDAQDNLFNKFGGIAIESCGSTLL
ncbi:MAG: SRPBCC family protein [Cyanobacteria bacterium P01_A01_bin.17]